MRNHANPLLTTSAIRGIAALVGQHVTLFGLKRFECNGLNGVVVAWDAETNRAGVKIDGSGETLAVQPKNIQISNKQALLQVMPKLTIQRLQWTCRPAVRRQLSHARARR